MTKDIFKREAWYTAELALKWNREGKSWEALLLIYMLMHYAEEIGYDL
jgi:hypothetical protein